MPGVSRFPKINLPYVDPKGDYESAQNWRYLNHVDWGGTGGRWGTVVIAASDSTVASKAGADYVCVGGSDQLTINSAISTIINRTEPGRVVFLEGTYTLSGSIVAALSGLKTIAFVGMGGGTQDKGSLITINTSSAAFSITGPSAASSSVVFRDIAATNTSSGRALSTNGARAEAHGCYFASTGGVAINTDGGLSGLGGGSHFSHCTVAAATRGISINHEYDTIITDCTVSVTDSAGRAIAFNSDAAYTVRGVIANCRVQGPGGTSWGIALNNGSADGTFVEDSLVQGNVVRGFGSGILLNGSKNCTIVGNDVAGCGIGIEGTNVGIVGNSRVLITSNYIYDSTGTAHVRIANTTIGTSDIAILYNKMRGTTPANAVVINSGCQDCAVAFNDTFSAWSSAAVSDSGTNTRRESDLIGGVVSTNARVGVRVSNGGSTYLRRRVDFVPTSPITTTISDDAVDEEVDVALGFDQTVDLNNNARVGVRKNSTGSTFKRRRMNLIEGINVTITTADDSSDEEVDITIAAASGGGTASYKVNGSSIGTESILNLVAGSGVTIGGVDTGTQVDVTISAGGAAAQAANEFNYAMHS